MSRQLFVLIALLSSVAAANGATAVVYLENIGLPEDIAYSPGDGPPLEVTLQLGNDSQSSSLPILLWQFGLQLQAAPSAVGSAQFSEVAIADDSVFGPSSTPSTGDVLPANAIVVSDTDPTSEGVSLAGNTSKNIVTLAISISGDATGDFALTMAGYDEGDLDHSSFWIPQSDDLPTTPFTLSAFTLATIHVAKSAAFSGDYNDDGIVDAADYSVWRDTLGQIGSGLAADGNGNQTIDAGDYDAWVAHFGQSLAPGAAANAPEPSTAALLIIGCLVALVARRR